MSFGYWFLLLLLLVALGAVLLVFLMPRSDVTFSLGGSVTGFTTFTGTEFTLFNNGGDALSITSDGPFTFSAQLVNGSSYVVTASDPACVISYGNGFIPNRSVNNIVVDCSS